jgi:hypothetical protein
MLVWTLYVVGVQTSHNTGADILSIDACYRYISGDGRLWQIKPSGYTTLCNSDWYRWDTHYIGDGTDPPYDKAPFTSQSQYTLHTSVESALC